MTNKHNKDIDRRSVLKTVGTASIGAVALAGGATAQSRPKGNSKVAETFSYDLRAYNSGVDQVTIITKIYENTDGDGRPAVLVRTPTLSEKGQSQESKVDISGGEHLVQAKAILTNGDVLTAEKVMSFPEGGIPEYSTIAVIAKGRDDFAILERKV